MHTEMNTKVDFESVFQPVLSALASLVRRIGRNVACNSDLSEIQSLLETLPLSSDDFGISCNRVSNARRYLSSHEWGAARWEIGMLASQLRNQAGAVTREPRRRLRGFIHDSVS